MFLADRRQQEKKEMKYDIKQISESVDILVLNVEEYERFMGIFVTAIMKHYPYINQGDIKNLSKLIMTDGFHRVEFIVKQDGFDSPTEINDSGI